MIARSGRYILPLCLLVTAAAAGAERINYQDHLLPLLRNQCASCHNADKKKAGLDVSTYSALMAGSDNGPVVSPGDPDASLLYKVVAHVQDPYMPKGQDKLSASDIDIFRKWIAGGAPETATGKAAVARAAPKLNLTLAATDLGRPKGPAAMPVDLTVEPVIHTNRAGALMCLAASPWAPLVAVGGQHQVLLYNTDTLELLGVLPFLDGDPYVARFSRNGSMLLVGGGVAARSGRVDLFDVVSGRRVTHVGDEFDAVIAADLSPDQSTVALGGPGRVLKLYSTADGRLLTAIRKHTDWVTAIRYSPDGVLLASGDRQGGLFVWEARGGNEFYTHNGHKAAITDLSFRGDSNILASASEDGTVKLWDMRTGTAVRSWNAHGGGVLSVAFAHDGRIVTCGRDRVVRIWKADGGRLLATAPFPDIALHAVFDGNDHRIVAGDWSGAVRVFDAKTAKLVGPISSDPQPIAERLADAVRRLTAARKMAKPTHTAELAADQLEVRRLQAAQVNADVWKLRDRLAARRAESDRCADAVSAATADLVASAARLASLEKLLAHGPAGDRSDVDAARHAVLDAASRRDSARDVLNERIELARQAGVLAERLSDLAAKSHSDSSLVAAAGAARRSFELTDAAVERADRELLARCDAVDQARRSAEAAERGLPARRDQIRAAPGAILAEERGAAAAADALLARLAAARSAAEGVAADQSGLESLARRYDTICRASSISAAEKLEKIH